MDKAISNLDDNTEKGKETTPCLLDGLNSNTENKCRVVIEMILVGLAHHKNGDF